MFWCRLMYPKLKKIGLRNHGECTGFGIAPQVLETEHSSKNFRYLKWMNSHLCKLFSGLCKGNPTPQNSRKWKRYSNYETLHFRYLNFFGERPSSKNLTQKNNRIRFSFLVGSMRKHLPLPSKMVSWKAPKENRTWIGKPINFWSVGISENERMSPPKKGPFQEKMNHLNQPLIFSGYSFVFRG